ncbi:MAG: hypothetical protein ACR2QC_01465 [Gammaproteobacteria bacterium]
MNDMKGTVFAWDGQQVSVKQIGEILESEGFYVSVVGKANSSYLVTIPPMKNDLTAGEVWLVWDNGGEFGVTLVNKLDARFVPSMRAFQSI